jgi:molybdopterin/thiamine biosynthesis adenylyltransferase
MGIFTVPPTMRIGLIGAGGIGAITGITLAKMGVRFLTIFDDDRVDNVNLPTQFHTVGSVHTNKAEALAGQTMLFSDEALPQIVQERVDENTLLDDDIVISAVDSITARKQIWEAVKKTCRGWYLDARMSAEIFHLYIVNMDLEDTGFHGYDRMISEEDEKNVPDVVCTEKATIYTACIAAGHIGKAVRDILRGEQHSKFVYHNIKMDRLEVYNL